ncbi:MAG: phosphatase domain-containing protein [Chloroflexota bacterium]
MSFKQWLGTIITTIENSLDWLKEKLATSAGLDDPLLIQPYMGFGNQDQLTIKGRILEDEGDKPPMADDSVWQNILKTYRFLESDEVPNAVVEATCAGMVQTAVSDEEGFFTMTFKPETPLTEDVYRFPVQLKLLEAPRKMPKPVTAVGEIVVAEKTAEFGIISDIDDTILKSSATNVIDAIKWMFLYNAKTRLPFDGVAHFYQSLTRGKNPMFYVSSSPWNLYPMLVDFMENQNIPRGPLFLKDYGLSKEQLLTSGHKSHKLTQIHTILKTYPNLPFILIGDSGQKDPEIYQEVVNQYPNQILAVYIRDVSKDKRDQQVLDIANRLKDRGVDMLLVATSTEAFEHACEKGFIPQNENQMTSFQIFKDGKLQETRNIVNSCWLIWLSSGELTYEADGQAGKKGAGLFQARVVHDMNTDPKILDIGPDWLLTIDGIAQPKRFYEEVKGIKGKIVSLQFKNYECIFHFTNKDCN